jgi:dienelactone hydrolase
MTRQTVARILILCIAAALNMPAASADVAEARIPAARLFAATSDGWAHQISPDGSRLVFSLYGKPGRTWFAQEFGREAVTLADFSRLLAWSQNNRAALVKTDEGYFVRDVTGAEDGFRFNPKLNGKWRVANFPTGNGNTVFVSLSHISQTGRKEYQLYECEFRQLSPFPCRYHLTIQNDNVTKLTYIAPDGGLVLTSNFNPSEQNYTLQVNRPTTGSRPLLTHKLFETVRILAKVPGGRALWALSNRNRNHVALVMLDLQTGRETVFAEEQDADIKKVIFDRDGSKPVLIAAYGSNQIRRYPDASVKAVFEKLQNIVDPASQFVFYSQSLDRRRFVVGVINEKIAGAMYILDTEGQSVRQLSQSPRAEFTGQYSRTRAISIRARDGMNLSAYLIRPRTGADRAGPFVIRVHGGPWYRYYKYFDKTDQFLASHGYSVLRLNFRGSTGLGMAYLEAGKGQIATGIQNDIKDTVTWAINNGIADARQIAVMGASFGGYAALLAASQEDHIFKAAISINGVTDYRRTLGKWLNHPVARGKFEHLIGIDLDKGLSQAGDYLKANSPMYRRRTWDCKVRKPHRYAYQDSRFPGYICQRRKPEFAALMQHRKSERWDFIFDLPDPAPGKRRASQSTGAFCADAWMNL